MRGDGIKDMQTIGIHTHHQSTKAVLTRLSKATGQLNGVRRMVEDRRDCAEVLIQLEAVRSAVNSICRIILIEHIDHCIVNAIRTCDMEIVDQLYNALDIVIK
jgi:CsoR family transcriptional regulator, copper-sensing transcriptional repressor